MQWSNPIARMSMRRNCSNSYVAGNCCFFETFTNELVAWTVESGRYVLLFDTPYMPMLTSRSNVMARPYVAIARSVVSNVNVLAMTSAAFAWLVQRHRDYATWWRCFRKLFPKFRPSYFRIDKLQMKLYLLSSSESCCLRSRKRSLLQKFRKGNFPCLSVLPVEEAIPSSDQLLRFTIWSRWIRTRRQWTHLIICSWTLPRSLHV